MSELTDFLLRRIAEDEAAANGAERDHQSSAPHWGYCEMVWADNSDPSWTPPCTCDMPAHVLAECEAKREIVKDQGLRVFNDPSHLSIFGARILGHLARPYADHPDFDNAWRP